MPKVGNYRANSVIYFQGDVVSDKVFVLQQGKVSLNYTDIETAKEIREIIQTGEFFGVKSALGKYPREENAVVLSDAQVLVFTVPEFEVFAQAQTRIIMKMLKVFSNQLGACTSRSTTSSRRTRPQSPEAGLFKAGEYYLKARQYSQAKYIFSRYLTYYPAGRLAEQASRYLEAAESGSVKYGDGKGPAPLMVEATRAGAPARETDGRRARRAKPSSVARNGEPARAARARGRAFPTRPRATTTPSASSAPRSTRRPSRASSASSRPTPTPSTSPRPSTRWAAASSCSSSTTSRSSTSPRWCRPTPSIPTSSTPSSTWGRPTRRRATPSGPRASSRRFCRWNPTRTRRSASRPPRPCASLEEAARG